MAMIGRPAAPVQPQNVSGLGRLDDEPVEVGRRAVAGEQDRVRRGAGRAEAAEHVERCAAIATSVSTSCRTCRSRPSWRFGRSTPMAWNGPLIHSSMWLRALVLIDARHGDVAAVAGDVTFGV